MTDLLGEMETWTSTETTVRSADGTLVRIPLSDIVSGKPVPPRPSTRLRVTPAEAEGRALAGWPAVEATPLGDWLLRAAGGFSARANSVLALGSPDRPLAEAVAAVQDFYAARDLPPWAQVVVGSHEQALLEDSGWKHARPGEADSLFQVASVAMAARELRDRTRAADTPMPATVTLAATASAPWLANDDRAQVTPSLARAVLEGPHEVSFLSVGPPDGPLHAKGRVSLADGRDGGWAGITDVWVEPSYRRQGLAVLVMRELISWAAERGATTAYLQTRGDNPAALALYGSLGFSTHHEYRYLVAPEPRSSGPAG